MSIEITWTFTGKSLKYDGLSQRDINKLVSHVSKMSEKEHTGVVVRVW